MKTKKKPLNYLSVIKYILLLFGFMLLNRLESEIFLYSASLFAAAIVLGSSTILTTVALIASFLLTGTYGLLPSVSVSAAFLVLVKLLYSHFNIKIKYEISIFTAISLIGFIILGDTVNEIGIE